MHRLGWLIVLLTLFPLSDLKASPCPMPQGDGNLITREQIEESGATNAHEAIRRLRPQFLRRRGVDVSGTGGRPLEEVNLPVLFVDQRRRENLDWLEQIPADQVEEIRYLSGPDASRRYGNGHSAGAILVTTRR